MRGSACMAVHARLVILVRKGLPVDQRWRVDLGVVRVDVVNGRVPGVQPRLHTWASM